MNTFGHGALLDSIESNDKTKVLRTFDKYCYNDGRTINKREAYNGMVQQKR